MLATKLFAPIGRPRLVARKRLVVQLDHTLTAGHRLTLVSAPAGFGKTTAVSHWLRGLQQYHSGVEVGWLSLDEGDNDLTRFLAHMIAALSSAGLDIDPSVIDAGTAGAVSAALPALVNDLAHNAAQAPDTHRVLVLDDHHTIAATPVHEAIAFLLDQLPPQLHLVVATRSDPPLPLARLRSRGQLTEVRAADLRFTPDEARDFLNLVMGLDLTAADVEALDERTEGWIAGLQLAGLSLAGISERRDVAGFIDAFTGSNRFVIDYLADEVLARQPADVRDFLLHTAVLDLLTGPLCDEVTGRVDSARVLESLERENVFVVPLDRDRSQYRYHHLFADVLRARLLSEQPGQLRGLHQRASAWYAVNGDVESAVRHSLSAEDFDRAAYLMESAIPELRRARQDGTLLAWADRLPEAVVRRSPVLSIMSAWALLMSGELDRAGARLNDAEAALAAGAVDHDLSATWAETEDLRNAPAMIAIYRASLAQARGDIAETVRQDQQALDLAEPDDHFVRGAGAGFLGLAAWAGGDVREALTTFTEAVGSLHAAGNVVDELDSTVVLADLWVAAGRPSRARRLYEQAIQRVKANGDPYPRSISDQHVGLAELDCEADELASAAAHLETAQMLRERGSITENQHRWFVAMAQLRAAEGDCAAAWPLLDHAEALYRRGFYPELRPIAAVRARLQIRAGDLTSAAAWADERRVAVADGPDYLHEFEQLTLVRLLLAEHRARGRSELSGVPAAVDAALAVLDRCHAAAAESERDGSLLEIRVLHALAYDASGDRSRALAVLDHALTEAREPNTQARLFVDEGAPMAALLDLVVGQPPTLARHGRLADPLSRRELDVLRRLDSELTGPAIARELYVSLNTFRTHTKRIFTKLDVTTRAGAVRRARELGLL